MFDSYVQPLPVEAVSEMPLPLQKLPSGEGGHFPCVLTHVYGLERIWISHAGLQDTLDSLMKARGRNPHHMVQIIGAETNPS